MTAPTADAAPVLALIQAAGLPGFQSSEPGAEPLNSAAADDADPVLALIHASGLPGFRSSGLRVEPLTTAAADDADPVLALIQAAGLPGFVRREHSSPPSSLSPSSTLASAAPAPKPAASTAPLAPVSALKAPHEAAAISTPFMSTIDYFILEISGAQGQASLALLESTMGVELAGIRPGGAFYSSRATATGNERALSFSSHQRDDLQSALPALNRDGLRARIGPIPVKLFATTGPGATGSWANGSPPQITSDAVDALKALAK